MICSTKTAGYFVFANKSEKVEVNNVIGYGDSYIVSDDYVLFKDRKLSLKTKFTKFFSCSSINVSVCNDDIIRLYKHDFEQYMSFPFYGGKCTSIAASVMFHTIAVANKGHLILFSTNNGETKSISYHLLQIVGDSLFHVEYLIIDLILKFTLLMVILLDLLFLMI